jgi:hypothetical protein
MVQGISGEDGRSFRLIAYVQSDAFSVLVVHDFDGIAIEDGDNLGNPSAPDDTGSILYCGGMGWA